MITNNDKTIEEFIELDNSTLSQISLEISEIIKTREKLLIESIENKNIDNFLKINKFFQKDTIPLNALNKLKTINYIKNDRKFFNYLVSSDNYLIPSLIKEQILFRYIISSFRDKSFYEQVKKDLSPKEIKLAINKNFSINSLYNASPEIFLDLIQTCDIKLSLKNFENYTENKSLEILEKICEHAPLQKFLRINFEKITDLAVFRYQEKTAKYLINKFNSPKKVAIFLSHNNRVKKLCQESNIAFFTYVLKEFDFENDLENILPLMSHLENTDDPERWKIAIESLVQNHINTPNIIDEIKLKIESSENIKYKEFCEKQFNYLILNESLREKTGNTKKIKI